MKLSFTYGLGAAFLASAGLGSAASAAFVMDMVTVGSPGNAAHVTTYDGGNKSVSQGAVSYEYKIGKYEVTFAQYVDFLNAVAKDDPNYIYDYAQGQAGIIQQSGSSGNYTYSLTDSNYANRPATSVTYWNALRFINWLHNGQPTGAQGSATTEDGSYTITSAGITAKTIGRNANATYRMPSDDEWYKAAYYDPTLNAGSGGYYNYPTSNNTTPGRDTADLSGNNANYRVDVGGNPDYLDPTYKTTQVGEFQASESPWGTFDQGGNVREWTERVGDTAFFGQYGGSNGNYSNQMAAGYYYAYTSNNNPAFGGGDIGFRVAYVPEPGTLTVLTLGAAGLLMRRRRA